MKTYHLTLASLILLAGCAGFSRDCSSCCAGALGSDWLVVQYRNDGVPINCWRLQGAAIDNESNSDGIFWKSPEGHLVHISGWYNRVQVVGSWETAADALGIELSACRSGKYSPAAVDAGPQ